MYRAIMSNIDIGANFVPCIVGPFKDEAIEVFINTAAWFGTLKDSNFTTGLYIDNSHVEKKIRRPFIAGENRIRNLVNKKIASYFKVIIEAYDRSNGFGKLPAAINLISKGYNTKEKPISVLGYSCIRFYGEGYECAKKVFDDAMKDIEEQIYGTINTITIFVLIPRRAFDGCIYDLREYTHSKDKYENLSIIEIFVGSGDFKDIEMVILASGWIKPGLLIDRIRGEEHLDREINRRIGDLKNHSVSKNIKNINLFEKAEKDIRNGVEFLRVEK